MTKEYKVKTLKNGEKRYIFDVNLGYRADGSRIRTTVSAKSIKEGRKKVAELRLGEKQVINNSDLLFEDAYQMYLEDCKRKGQSPVTLYQKQNTLSWNFSYFTKIKITKITDKDISLWSSDLRENYKDVTARRIEGYLCTFLNWCKKKKIITINPFDYVDKTKVKKQELNFWTEDEFKQFISVVDDDYYKLAFTVLFYTGVRKGELFGLSYEDIQGHELHLSKTYKGVAVNGNHIYTDFKTEKSKRIVPLPEWLDIGTGTGLIFPYGYVNIRKVANRYMSAANVKRIRIHDFRHSYVAMLINKGVDIYTIAELVGHTDIKMTMNTYAHLYPNKRRQISKIL